MVCRFLPWINPGAPLHKRLNSIADVLEKKLLPDNWEDSDDLDMWVELSDLVTEMREVPENVSVAQVDELLDELYGWADFHRVWIK